MTAQLILLAEDNAINCKVIQEQLRVLNYSCEVARDGKEALQMWRSGRFSLLLTDCNMPNMDGFELTQAIRESEPPGKRMPIIAITANVLRSEIIRCHTSGMDDFISKPIRINELSAALAKWLSNPTGDEVQPVNRESDVGIRQGDVAAQLLIWDSTTLTRLVGEHSDIQRGVLEDYLVASKELVTALNMAISSGDAKLAGDVAHKLKSASRTVGALRLGELCQQMETSGRAGDLTFCSGNIEQLNKSFAASIAAIVQFLG